MFNLGSDEPIEILAAPEVELVRETLGSRSPIEQVPYARACGPGFDDLRHRQPDLTRIRNATGFKPATPLVQTIHDLARELRRGSASVESAV